MFSHFGCKIRRFLGSIAQFECTVLLVYCSCIRGSGEEYLAGTCKAHKATDKPKLRGFFRCLSVLPEGALIYSL